MRIGVAALPDENRHGFALFYANEPDTTEGTSTAYVYQDGAFIESLSEE